MKTTPASKLILLLLAARPLTYVSLLTETALHPNTLLKHLKSLTAANLITHDRSINTYSLTPSTNPSDSPTPIASTPLTV